MWVLETELWSSEELYILLTAEPSLQLHLHNFQGLFSCPTVFFLREIVIFNIYTIPEIRPTVSFCLLPLPYNEASDCESGGWEIQAILHLDYV